MNALSIEGTVVNILFENQPKTYVVAQLKQATESLPTVIVGGLSNIRTGEFLICHGDWKTHKSYGEQFWVDSYEVRLPTTRKSILDYLSSGWITGIGKGLAKKIVDVFGVDTFDIIEHSPEKLLTIRGISKRAQQAIVEAWSDQKESREILVFLQQHELSPHLAQKIYKQYGGFSTQTLRMNPYCLAEDIFGVGFVKADEIAQKLGIPADSLFRLEAGLLYMLKELARAEGHTCYPLEVFRQRALPFLKTSPELVDKGLSELLKSKKIHIDTYIPLGSDQPTEWIWLKYFHSSERGIVEHIRRLQTAPAIPTPKLEQALQEETNRLGIRLSDQQLEAVKACFEHKIHIITGGAGVGKSTIIKLVLRIFSHYTDKIVLAAPTGRAAKRLSEICNHPASTIHALLAGSASELEVAGAVAFQLSAEVVIVDETSMVDTLLLYALVKSLKNDARLVMVGDYNQLESVGAGDVLKNLIHSGQIPTSQLTEIFRQAAQSQIIAYADSVNRGIMPKFERVETGDFFFLNKSNPLEVVELVKELVVQRLPKRYGFDLLKDIQVLTPMNKGSLGTKVLNDALQKVCNPATEVLQNGLEVGYNRFWAGDKVIQTKNNYDKSVFNGDIGYVETVDMVNRCMQVNFEGRTVEYKQQEAMELELAYAISVHKYQGSECAGVIFILHDTHYKMLTRNLLYTGITRGKKLVLLLGTEQAVYTAVENNRSLTRYTGLLQFLLPDSAHLFEPIRHVPMLGSDNYAEFLKACQELGID